MNISTVKLAIKYIFGGASGVAEYVLELLKNYLASLNDATKENIQKGLNATKKALNILTAIAWLIPTKWQTAYGLTIKSVEAAVDALSDLEITTDELEIIKDRITAAYNAWRGDDDETCIA